MLTIVDELTFYCDEAQRIVCLPYTVPNLHRMAKALGIKRCWFHTGATYPHYDMPKTRRAEIVARCHVVSTRELLALVKACSQRDNEMLQGTQQTAQPEPEKSRP